MRMRQGRKRSIGPRRPNGRPVQEKRISPADIAARQPHRGSVSQDDAVDAIAECELGRMHLRDPKRITRLHYEAGINFATVVAKYRAILGGPKPVVSGGRGYDCRGDIPCHDCECEKRKILKQGADDALRMAGGPATKAVYLVAVEDKICPPSLSTPLIWGLCALQHHFGLEPYKKSTISTWQDGQGQDIA